MNYNVEDNFCASFSLVGLENDSVEIQKRITDALACLVPVPLTAETVAEPVQPGGIKVGDMLWGYGFVGKVEKIEVVNQKYELPIYIAAMSYVRGDLSNYKFLRGNICNGCFCGDLAKFQGNNRATWRKVV